MKKLNPFLFLTALGLITAGVLFFSQKAWAMPVGTILYRTSAQGQLFGLNQSNLIDLENYSGLMPKLRINCGHAGLYVGQIDGQEMVLEAVNNGVQLSLAKYFVNTKEGERLIGARYPLSEKIKKAGKTEIEARIQKIAIFFKKNKMAYDFEFKNQKGPGSEQWTCVGLTEKIYESLGFNSIDTFTQSSFVYAPVNYFADITPDGLDDYNIFNYENMDVFSKSLEFSRISRRSFEGAGYALGKLVNDNRYFFLPYTQYSQDKTLKSVLVDIDLESSFDVNSIRGKVPADVYAVLVDNASGGKISGTQKQIKKAEEKIIAGVQSAKQSVASAWESSVSAVASLGKSVWQSVPAVFQAVGQASQKSSGVLIKGDGSSGVPIFIQTQNEPFAVLAGETANIVISPQEPSKAVLGIKKTAEPTDSIKLPPLVKNDLVELKNKTTQDLSSVDEKIAKLEKVAEESLEIVDEVQKTADKILPLPLVHYPFMPGSGQEAGAELEEESEGLEEENEDVEELPLIPRIFSMRLVDSVSSSSEISLSRSLKLFFDIENQASVDAYFLSEGDDAVPSEQTVWFPALPEEISLSSGDGEKTVRVWISYNQASEVASSAASIFLDTALPEAGLDSLLSEYEQSGFTVSWFGGDGTGLGVADFDLEYSTSTWISWLTGATSTSAYFDIPIKNFSSLSFRVRARDLAGHLGEWSAVATTSIRKIAPVLISEFATRGLAGAYDEFVELYNPNDEDISITSWELMSKSVSTSSDWVLRSGSGLPDVKIKARSYFLLSAKAYSGDFSNYRHNVNWGLSDAGGSLKIIDGYGQDVDVVSYGSAALPESSLFSFGLDSMAVAERKAFKESSAESMSGSEKWSGNAYDSDSDNDFFVKAQSDPQNSFAPPEPNANSSLTPSTVHDLSAVALDGWNFLFSWTAPENSNFHSSARYDLRYVVKTSDCLSDFIWDSAISVPFALAPGQGGEEQSFTAPDFEAGTEYCFALKTFNGYNWSSISGIIEAKTQDIFLCGYERLIDRYYFRGNS